MTADVELLPLPSVLLNWPHPTNHAAIRDYARACVAHATAAKDAEIKWLQEAYRGQVIERANEIKLREKADAEIEALRAEVAKRDGIDPWAVLLRAQEAEARAERLAEALHKLEEACDDSDGAQYGTLGTSFVRGICKDALLRDHDQELSNG